MEPKPWRDRIHDEDELLTRLNRLVSASADRRAQALIDGVAELGTRANVARDLGLSWTAVDKAITKYGNRKAAGTNGATPE
jgi:DNA-binding phage protein